MVAGSGLPPLGFGCGGAMAWPWIVSRTEGRSLLRKAFDSGIRFFDTGHAYCGGRAESLLGEAIREFGRQQVVISTKLGTHPVGRFGRVRKGFEPGELRNALHVSLRRLGVEEVDALFLHSPSDVDLEPGIAFLESARGLGQSRLIGASIEPHQWRCPAIARCDVIMIRSDADDPVVADAIAGLRSQGKHLIAKRAIRRRQPGWLPRGARRADLWYWAREIKDRSRHRGGATASSEYRTPGAALVETLKVFDSVVFGSTRSSHVASNVHAVRSSGIDPGAFRLGGGLWR
jgi:hypothetical protein